ncbi:MAG: TonB-dependent receptor [Pseudomonadota bacterium]
MNRLLVLLPLFLGASTVLAAAESDSDELQQLMALLDEQTEIATKTKLNADYVPGLVTVLHGDDLANRGVRTVWEALALVPGIELSIEETGRKQIVVRGVGRTYASGNVKLLLNNVSMNSAQNGMADPVFNIPVQQVERIEVIRGPGSAIHGEYAFAGVVNVITRSGEQALFTSLAKNNGYTVGGNITQQAEDGSWRVNLNLAASGSDGATVNSGPDAIYSTFPTLTYSPGPTNEMADYQAALFNFTHGDFDFKLQWSENGYGDHFGINNELPPPTKNIVSRYSFTTAEAQQTFRPGDKLVGHVTIGWQESRETKDDLFAYQWGLGEPDIIVDLSYGEERLYGGVDLIWKGIQSHTLFAELTKSYIHVNEAWQKYNIDINTGLPSSDMFDWGDYKISKDKSRHIGSLTLQDEYNASDRLTITTGLRYDTYSDVGDSINPRLAAVWQLDRNQTLKAQYARAFRPSSFYELGGSVSSIDPATVDSLELAHIYRTPNITTRAVLFGSSIDNLVVFDETVALGYSSIEAETMGLELELEKRLSRQFKVAGDVSYVDTYDVSTGEQLAFSSSWLGNLGLFYQLRPQLLTNLQLRYVGLRNRESSDSRSALESYSSVDATISHLNLVPGMTLRAGVKNMFDQDIRYPAPVNTYVGDYPRPGQQWWVDLNYSF